MLLGRRHLRRLLYIGVVAACSATVQAQAAKSKCKPGSKDPACVDPAPAPSPQKSLGEEFPFPTEDSKGTAAPQKGTDTNAFPSMPTSGVPDPPSDSEKPMRLPPENGASSSSSSSSDDGARSSSDSDDDVAPTTASPNAPVKAAKLKDLGSKADMSGARAKLELTRVQDDLKIGRFYLQDGNTQGAYLRFKDAVDHAPEEPEARFNLAEAAVKLNKRDEAVLNYREYLKLDAEGDHDKASRAALKKLGASAQ